MGRNIKIVVGDRIYANELEKFLIHNLLLLAINYTVVYTCSVFITNKHFVIDILPLCGIILIQVIASLSSGVLRARGLLYTRGTMADKSYKSYRQQLNILRSRGMIIEKGSHGSRVMRMLLSKSDLNNFIYSMKTAFGKLQKQLHTISVEDIMSKMGYDSNWTNLANLM